MNKRVLHLRAEITKDTSILYLDDINKIKPFSFNIYNAEHKTLEVIIKNGGKRGKGLQFNKITGSLSRLTIFNGKHEESRRKEVGIEFAFTNYQEFGLIYAIKNVFDRKFLEDKLDYKFDILVDDNNQIINNIKGKRNRACFCVEFLNKYTLKVEVIDILSELNLGSIISTFSDNIPNDGILKTKENTFIIYLKPCALNIGALLAIISNCLGIYIWRVPSLNENKNVINNTFYMDFKINNSSLSYPELQISTLGIPQNKTKIKSIYKRVRNAHPSNSVYYTNKRILVGASKTSFDYIDALVYSGDKGIFTGKWPGEALDEKVCYLKNIFRLAEMADTYNKNEIDKHIVTLLMDGVFYNHAELVEIYNKEKSIFDVGIKYTESDEKGRIVLTVKTNLSKEILEHLKQLDEIKLDIIPPQPFSIKLNSKSNSITETGVCLKLEEGPYVYNLNTSIKTSPEKYKDNLHRCFNMLNSKCLNYVVLKYKEGPTYALYKTTRCTPSDFIIKIGAEFETGIPAVRAKQAKNYEDFTGAVVSHCYDGGGIELRTSVVENPTLFKWIGRFDALCKQIRNNKHWSPYTGSSTHFHISINPAPKKLVEKNQKQKEINPTWYGDALFRRSLMGINWWHYFMKYTLGLSFYDVFTQNGRRHTNYGLPIYLTKNLSKEKEIRFNDARFSEHWGKNPNEVIKNNAQGRNVLLRVCKVDKNILHYEWRGTDPCPSALFTGLKAELLTAITKKAIAETLDGTEHELFPIHVKQEIEDLVNVKYGLEIVSKVCRAHAIQMVEELREWLSPEAYKGLKAWALFVNIISSNVGKTSWYEENEELLIKRIGISNFLTNTEVLKECEYDAVSKIFYPKETSNKGKKYEVILPHNDLIGTANRIFGTEPETQLPYRRIRNNIYPGCCACGTTAIPTILEVENLKFCENCKNLYTENGALKEKFNKQFSERSNTSDKYKKLIKDLVSKPLITKEI